MPIVCKSAIVPLTCERMFALVDECERYPEFMPWCEAAEVVSRTPEVTHARLHVAYGGLRTAIATRNVREPPARLTLELLEGPFEHFHGEWTFVALGPAGCRVELALEYRLAGKGFERLLGPVFGHIAETMVQSFVARAEASQDAP